MRASGASVSVSESDLSEFRRQWPASGLSGLRGVAFEFDSNGDLVDIRYRNGTSDHWDGPALVALSQDAQAFGTARRDTSTRRTMREECRKSGHYPWWWPPSWGP